MNERERERKRKIDKGREEGREKIGCEGNRGSAATVAAH